jgi:hypothetical protein
MWERLAAMKKLKTDAADAADASDQATALLGVAEDRANHLGIKASASAPRPEPRDRRAGTHRFLSEGESASTPMPASRDRRIVRQPPASALDDSRHP